MARPLLTWYTPESLSHIADIIVENVTAFAEGNPINEIHPS
jgi:hypothetical protein